jgi:hypothetical protein
MQNLSNCTSQVVRKRFHMLLYELAVKEQTFDCCTLHSEVLGFVAQTYALLPADWLGISLITQATEYNGWQAWMPGQTLFHHPPSF